MKYLVIGAAGFIGSNLVKYLLDNGHEVIAIDDLSLGHHDNIDVRARVIIAPLDSKVVTDVLDNIRYDCDCIFWLADKVGVETILNTHTLNVVESLNNIKKIIGFKKVIFTSSSEVYGYYNPCSLTEDRKVLNFIYHKRFTYAWVKLLEEFIIVESFPNFVIMRLFNVFGPRQRIRAGVIPKLIYSAFNNKTIFVHGTFNYRSFIYVKDLVKIMEIFALSDFNGIINVGGLYGTSILDLALKIKKLLKSRSKIEVIPKYDYTIEFRVPELEKLHDFLGENFNFTDFDTALNETIDWYISTFKEGGPYCDWLINKI